MNTQILEMALMTITGILVVVLTYMVAKITLIITMRKIREEKAMLDEQRDDELKRYQRMFGPLKDWEDSEWVEKAEKVRNGSMGPDKDDELPF